jgi:hypothetical protein
VVKAFVTLSVAVSSASSTPPLIRYPDCVAWKR